MAVQEPRTHEPSVEVPLAQYAPEDKYRDDPGYGWVMFAGVLLLIVGMLSLIYGLAAVGNSHFVAGHPRYIIGTLHTWGWIGVILGVLELTVGFGVFVKNQLSRWVGVCVLGVAAIVELLRVQTYPLWSLSLFALAILAMYGLIAHGDKISTPKPRVRRPPATSSPGGV